MKKIILWFTCIAQLAATGTTQCDAHDIEIRILTGPQAREYVVDIAHIRMTFFKEYPYLYEGTLAGEKQYLEKYFSSPDAVVLLVFDNDEVVGLSNSIPLIQEFEELKAPFAQKGLNLKDYLYIGEAIIYPPYRGKGLLRKFAEFHENRARDLGYAFTVFMTVERPDNHPLKPNNYRSLDPICKYFGYAIATDLQVHIPWTQIDTQKETDNTLAIWQKAIV